MSNRLRAFYTPRKNVKRGRRGHSGYHAGRFPFISFEYSRGGVVERQLTLIQEYFDITYKARAARLAVTITAKSATVASIRGVLADITVESGPYAMLRIEAVPDEVNLGEALLHVKVVIAQAQSTPSKYIEFSSVTNRLAYEVSIGYVATKIAKYAAEDSTR